MVPTVFAAALLALSAGAQAQNNLSLTGTAVSSSETSEARATTYANDNDVSTRWQGVALQDEWVGIQWTQPVTFNKVVIQTAYDRYKGYRLLVLKPGGNRDNDADFVEIGAATLPGTGNIQIQPIHTVNLNTPVTTTEIRFQITDSVDQVGVRELQVFYLQGEDLNLSIQGTPVSSSESGETRATAYVNDGVVDTRWQPATRQNEWVGVQWSNPVTFNKVVVRTAYDRFKGYRLLVLKPGGNRDNDADFVEIGAATLPGTGNIQVQPIYNALLPTPVTTTEIRFFIPDSVELGGVRELETFNVAAGTISGVVTDVTTGRPVQGVSIIAAPGDVTATTDAEGKYSLVLQAGTFDVRASLGGTPASGGYFARTQSNIGLTAGQTMSANFALTPSVNLARTATATASTESEAMDVDMINYTELAPMANDGDTNTFWRPLLDLNTDEWLSLKWAQPQTFNFLVVREAGDFVANWALQSMNTTSNEFSTIGSGTGPATADPRLDYSFAALSPAPLTSNEVRFLIQTGVGTPGVREFEVFNVQTGTVSGVVRDAASKAALSGIQIQAAAGPLNLTATTDANGAFTLTVPVGPTMDIVASRLQTPSTPGYVAHTAKGVAVGAGRTARGEILLNVAATNLAFTATATASTEEADFEAGKVNDGLATTSWRYEDGEDDPWVQLDWTTAQTFNRVIVAGIGQIPGFDVNAFDEATGEFVRVGGGDHAVPQPGTQNIVVDLKEAVTTKQLQVVVTGPLGQKPSIHEVQVFNATPQTAPPVPVFTEEGGGGGGGDVNGDGVVDIKDATLSLQFAVELQTPTAAQRTAGDVNGDGALDIKDTTTILRRAVGL